MGDWSVKTDDAVDPDAMGMDAEQMPRTMEMGSRMPLQECHIPDTFIPLSGLKGREVAARARTCSLTIDED
jgi:hypothetical protein